jgi:hypothetical protein
MQSLHSLGELGFELESETFLLAGAAERVLAGIGALAKAGVSLFVPPHEG